MKSKDTLVQRYSLFHKAPPERKGNRTRIRLPRKVWRPPLQHSKTISYHACDTEEEP
jgi:hypothetical protein